MINLAVIELKDIVKYLIKITITIVTVIALTKFFSSFKTKLNIDKNSFLSCLDIEIPSIKLAKNKEENIQANLQKKKPLKMALDLELGVLSSIENEEKAVENQTEESKDEQEEIKEAETGLNTEVIENNVPEKYTSEYNGVKIRNETDIKLTKAMLTPNVNVNTKNIVILSLYHLQI